MQTYKPETLNTSIIRDPKTRKISESAFRDRIVHYAIFNIIEHTFDKRFICDSSANRIRPVLGYAPAEDRTRDEALARPHYTI